MTRQAAMLLTLSLLAAGSASSGVAESAPEDAAIVPAQAWLVLVDQGKYAESWDEAAALFKSAITKQRWQESLVGVRAPLGTVLSRRVRSRRYAESLPGAPDGKYVVIQFDTVFEHKSTAVETVTPMLDRDGRWRVSGYYINPHFRFES